MMKMMMMVMLDRVQLARVSKTPVCWIERKNDSVQAKTYECLRNDTQKNNSVLRTMMMTKMSKNELREFLDHEE